MTLIRAVPPDGRRLGIWARVVFFKNQIADKKFGIVSLVELFMSDTKTQDTRTQTVVLIENDLDMCMLMEIALQAQDIVTRAFSSACDALVFLKEVQILPAVILVDLNMPAMSGAEFIERLRADERLRNITVILTSGTDAIASIAKKIGADGFLRKPFGLDELETLVKRELRNSRLSNPSHNSPTSKL